MNEKLIILSNIYIYNLMKLVKGQKTRTYSYIFCIVNFTCATLSSIIYVDKKYELREKLE